MPPKDAFQSQVVVGCDGGSALLVFSAEFGRDLSARQRLESTYVGVRRVRPSSPTVRQAPANAASNHSRVPVVFKTAGEDGVERRMTKREKKAVKWQLQNQRKEAKQNQRQQREQPPQPQQIMISKKRKRRAPTDDSNDNSTATLAAADPTEEEKNVDIPSGQSPRMMPDGEDLDHHSPSSDGWSDQELTDLSGDRHGMLPVMLPPPLARLAVPSNHHKGDRVVWDDALAQSWATALQQSMIPAEQTRQQEDMRPMAYQLVPQVWTRLRPPSLVKPQPGATQNVQPESGGPRETSTMNDYTGLESASESEYHTTMSQKPWSLVAIRPTRTVYSSSPFDRALTVVAEYLHRHSNLHLSCGVKFGCDLLLYDGPRANRHAFAGLRVVVHNDNDNRSYSSSFPLPSAYALAGYVRCLNTAGKLALLAHVTEETSGSRCCRLAVVDLMLQRVDGTKRQNMNERLKKLHRTAKSTALVAPGQGGPS